jgi:hypothetical protein
MTEMNERLANGDVVLFQMEANGVELMKQSDNDKNIIMMLRKEPTYLQSIVDDLLTDKKTSDDYIDMLKCQNQEDKATMAETKVQSTELQRIIDEMIIEKKISTEILADLDLRVLQLDSIACSERDFRDKLDFSHTVINDLEKKVINDSFLYAISHI